MRKKALQQKRNLEIEKFFKKFNSCYEKQHSIQKYLDEDSAPNLFAKKLYTYAHQDLFETTSFLEGICKHLRRESWLVSDFDELIDVVDIKFQTILQLAKSSDRIYAQTLVNKIWDITDVEIKMRNQLSEIYGFEYDQNFEDRHYNMLEQVFNSEETRVSPFMIVNSSPTDIDPI